ncbi:2OG-Fe(II) oxygenase [Spirosoma sp. SC4-14]|uniref:2OG-Fe(II) oxygenase n=1 Tax=Spirosoma sp. SC4-14 TaxID=3128900 RepID=UPI0030D5EB28
MNTTTADTLFDYDRWQATLPADAQRYQQNQPYPHIALENFLEPQAAERALAAFPAVGDAGWIHYVHVNEKKHGLNKMDLLPPAIQDVIREMNSPRFVAYLSQLTGIANLIPDDSLEGGGLHQSKRNGFLNVHADFTVHPHKRNWRRRVNLLIYLNHDWKPEYRGDLELWDRQMKGVVQKIAPIFNRCVIFNTDEDSYHGLPDPILCPDDMTRKSIALYYFTEETVTPTLRATNYKARPEDGAKAILIWLDKKMVATYTSIKRTLGIDDAFISNILNRLSGKK